MGNYILAIETSCDDTSIAVLEDNKVLSCVTRDSTKSLNEFGGIVPEIASRKHEEFIIDVFNDAIKQAKIRKEDINYICYTNEPGLPGSLHVGKTFALSLSYFLNIKAYPINHIDGHVLSPFINSEAKYPFISLIASGKTTSIFVAESANKIYEVIKTDDDALGETFDKIGKALGYPYPQGPWIDKNFVLEKAAINFPHPQINKNFSFSGIKNRVISLINNKKNKGEIIDAVEIGSSFQKWAIDILIDKLKFFKEKYNASVVAIGGGVSANSLFKKRIKELFEFSFVPQKEYSCDNAAMIGFAFYEKHIKKSN